MRVLYIVVAFLFVSARILPVDAEDSVPSVSPLLVLLAASDETSVTIERQLVAELRLTLDGVQVEQIAIEREDFLALTLPEQLDVVQPLIRRFVARAAVWVVTGKRGGNLVQFVVSDRGNATVRTVNAGSPEELALAVRELLDSTYLFNPKSKVTQNTPRATRITLGGGLGLNGGIVYEGASLIGGAAIHARVMPIERYFLGLMVMAKMGPRLHLDDGLVQGWRTEISLQTGYRFAIEAFGIGPLVELSVMRSAFSAIIGEGEYSYEHWWSFRGALGIEVALDLSEYLTIFIDWTLGGIARPGHITRASDQSVLLETPIMDYAFSLGLASKIR